MLYPTLHAFYSSYTIEKDKDGYFAFCPQLQGCNAQGATYEEVLENIKDVIKLHIEDIQDDEETFTVSQITSLT